MNFDQISNILQQRTPTILRNKDHAKYAILLPLIEQNNNLHLLFEVRSHQLRRQPNEICFPGGRIEKTDATKADAAVRETSEELGINPKTITDVSPLDYIISDISIYPFVGKLLFPEQISINTNEVAEVFTVPLSHFLETPAAIHTVNLRPEPATDFPYDLIPGGKNYQWRPRKLEEPFYQYEDKVIWGLTARVLRNFLETIAASS